MSPLFSGYAPCVINGELAPKIDEVNVEVYNESGTRIGHRSNFYGNDYYPWDVTSGQTYYIRVWPYNNDNGNYQIAFNSSSSSPSFSIANPDLNFERAKSSNIGFSRLLTSRSTMLNR